MNRLIVTLDGPAGAGKSTIARNLAKRLAVVFLDTGAMYRGLAWLALEKGVDLQDADALAALAAATTVDFDFACSPPALQVNGVRPGEAIRTEVVSQAASVVAKVPEVRERLVAAQRAVAVAHPRLVTEGRDQGSVVFPDATLKVWLTASPQERARRRVAQLQQAGQPADLAAVQNGIEERDRWDAQRANGPMVQPQGSVEVDTTGLRANEVLDKLVCLALEAELG